jgi:hypothetical protein
LHDVASRRSAARLACPDSIVKEPALHPAGSAPIYTGHLCALVFTTAHDNPAGASKTQKINLDCRKSFCAL